MTDQIRDPADAERNGLLTGSVRSAVFWLALPVLTEQFLSFLVGFYDTYLSGHLAEEITADATSAIGLAAYVGWLVTMLFGLVATGTTALVARFWGAGEFPQANRITNQSIVLAAAGGIILFALVYVAAPALAGLLGMQGRVANITVRYLRFDAVGHIFTGITLAAAAGLRGAGDTRSPMILLGLVSVLNVVVSRALVFGVGPLEGLGFDDPLIRPWGIDGIVAGTVVARVTGAVIMVGALSRGLSGLRLTREFLRIHRDDMLRILRIGAPAALDGAVMWAGHFVFLRIIASLGSDGMNSTLFAAHIVGIRVEAISYLPAVAWGVAAATIVGQSLGHGDRARAVRCGHEATFQCSVLAVAITLGFYFGADAIYELMHRDPQVRAAGIPALKMVAFFQIPLVVSIVYMNALRGAGDTRFPLWVTLVSVLIVRLPVAYLFGIVLDGGLLGAWIGMCADMLVRAVLMALRYTRGRWVETKV